MFGDLRQSSTRLTLPLSDLMSETQTTPRILFVGTMIVAPAIAGVLLDWCFNWSPMFTLIGSAFSVIELLERGVNRIGTALTRFSKPEIDGQHELADRDFAKRN